VLLLKGGHYSKKPFLTSQEGGKKKPTEKGKEKKTWVEKPERETPGKGQKASCRGTALKRHQRLVS